MMTNAWFILLVAAIGSKWYCYNLCAAAFSLSTRTHGLSRQSKLLIGSLPRKRRKVVTENETIFANQSGLITDQVFGPHPYREPSVTTPRLKKHTPSSSISSWRSARHGNKQQLVENADTTSRRIALFLSYAAISNLTACLTLSLSWYLTCIRTHQFPTRLTFLQTFGATAAAAQTLRPARVAAAVALRPVALKWLLALQQSIHLGVWQAASLQYCVAWLVTLPVLACGILLAHFLSGVGFY